MSAALQFVVFTWHALAPTIGTFLLSVIIPVTTVPCAYVPGERVASRIKTGSRFDNKILILILQYYFGSFGWMLFHSHSTQGVVILASGIGKCSDGGLKIDKNAVQKTAPAFWPGLL